MVLLQWLYLISSIWDVSPLVLSCLLKLQHDTWLEMIDFALMSVVFDNVDH